MSEKKLPPTPTEVRRYFAERAKADLSSGYTEGQLARNEELWKSIVDGMGASPGEFGEVRGIKIPLANKPASTGESGVGDVALGMRRRDRRAYQRELMRRRRARDGNNKE